MKENHFKIKPSPEQVERRNRLSEITAHILNILAKYKCDRDEIDGVLYNVKYSLQGTTRRPRNGLLTTNGAMLPARGIAPVCCGGIQRGQRPIWHTTLRSKV